MALALALVFGFVLALVFSISKNLDDHRIIISIDHKKILPPQNKIWEKCRFNNNTLICNIDYNKQENRFIKRRFILM